jgi:hypothetical protein
MVTIAAIARYGFDNEFHRLETPTAGEAGLLTAISPAGDRRRSRSGQDE